MRFRHDRVPLRLPDGRTVEAVAPVVLSASRATDVPAFHGEWLLRRLRAGWCVRRNPFNGRPAFVSFERARVLVLWTKDPAAVLRRLDALRSFGLGLLVLVTLNDYEREGLEPGVTPLGRRVDALVELGERLGRERVAWRFDPVLVGPGLPAEEVLARIERIGERAVPAVGRLVFSFVEVRRYRSVRAKLARSAWLAGRDPAEAEPGPEDRAHILDGLGRLGARWRARNPGFRVTSCATELPEGAEGVERGACIDGDLLGRLHGDDEAVRRLLGRDGASALPLGPPPPPPKDPNQRPACLCVPSQDIGAYDTCLHGCAYCYAVRSQRAARARVAACRPDAPALAG